MARLLASLANQACLHGKPDSLRDDAGSANGSAGIHGHLKPWIFASSANKSHLRQRGSWTVWSRMIKEENDSRPRREHQLSAPLYSIRCQSLEELRVGLGRPCPHENVLVRTGDRSACSLRRDRKAVSLPGNTATDYVGKPGNPQKM
jgi:hypothetical protein